MFQLLTDLLEFLSAKAPTEQDLLGSRAYKDLVATWPKLEKQLKLAWTGDARAKEKGEHKGSQGENVYLFPQMLKVSNLEKFDPDFALTMQAKRAVADLYKLFCDKFQIAHRTNRNWLEK